MSCPSGWVFDSWVGENGHIALLHLMFNNRSLLLIPNKNCLRIEKKDKIKQSTNVVPQGRNSESRMGLKKPYPR